MEQATERWQDVVGYEGLYLVSDHGRVRSVGRTVDHPRGQRILKGKVLKPGFSHGYNMIGLQKNGPRKFFYVHRLVAAAFIGPCPVGRQVNHVDGVKLNNQMFNLEYVTPSENTLHAYRAGLLKAICGTKHYSAKLSEADVLEIRAAHAAGGVTQQKLADKYGVARKSICKIIYRKSWRHLP